MSSSGGSFVYENDNSSIVSQDELEENEPSYDEIFYKNYVKKHIRVNVEKFKNIKHENLKMLVILWYLLDIVSIVPDTLVSCWFEMYSNKNECNTFMKSIVNTFKNNFNINYDEDGVNEEWESVTAHNKSAKELDCILSTYLKSQTSNIFVVNLNICLRYFHCNCTIPRHNLNCVFKSLRTLIKDEYFN